MDIENKTIEINDAFLEKRPLSPSSMKKFWVSPREYYHYLFEKKKDNEAYVIGNAVECKLLDKKNFENKFEPYTKFERRSKADKDKWQEMVENAKENNKTLINQEDLAIVDAMVKVAENNPNVMFYVERAQNFQRKIEWYDKATKLPFNGYIDFEVDHGGFKTIIDVKTTADATPEKFMKNMFTSPLLYHLQMGAYLTGYHKKYYQFPDFQFLCITKTEPYDAFMVYMPGKLIQEAKDEWEHLCTAFRYCMDNKQFDMGTDFWLFDTLNYHTAIKPKYAISRNMNQ